jgi:hypothetical protein
MFGESLVSGFDVVGVQATPSMSTASSYGNGARCGARTLRAAFPKDDDWPHASRIGCQGGDVVDQVSPVSDEPTAASPGGAKQTNPRQPYEIALHGLSGDVIAVVVTAVRTHAGLPSGDTVFEGRGMGQRSM